MQTFPLRAALVLGLLAAVGPLAIDMYLPALPSIEEALSADVASVQLTLSLYFAAFGLAQLVYGPLADQVGRKPPLFIGLGLFAAASVGCALAPDIVTLTVFRFVQGLGAAAVMVIPRAIVRDQFTGPQATRMMATIMLVISVAPLLAPLFGTAVLALASWRVIFVTLAGLAALALVLLGTAQPETLPPERRVRVNLPSLARGARTLIADPVFMGLTLIGGFGMASFFVFIASASFVYTQQYGLTELGFSLAFAANAVGFFGMSQVAGPLGARYGMVTVIGRAVTGFAAFAATLFAFVLSGVDPLWLVMLLLFCGNACLGLVIPTVMVAALDPHGEIAGLASSLGGTLQMLVGGAMIAASSPFFDGTVVPMVGAIALCAAAALTLTILTVPRLARATAAA